VRRSTRGQVQVKVTSVVSRGNGRFNINLDDGSTVRVIVEVLPELDNLVTFTAMTPSAWTLTGVVGGIAGDGLDYSVEPIDMGGLGTFGDAHESMCAIAKSGEMLAATIDAIRDIIEDVCPGALDEH